MGQLLLAAVAAFVGYPERDGILLDEIKQVLRGADNQLNLRPGFSFGVAAAKEIDLALTLVIPLPQLLPLGWLVLGSGVFVGDGKGNLLFLLSFQPRRDDL